MNNIETVETFSGWPNADQRDEHGEDVMMAVLKIKRNGGNILNTSNSSSMTKGAKPNAITRLYRCTTIVYEEKERKE